MKLGPEASLIDVAFAVCTALDESGIAGVLTGGSAATFYVPDRYQSMDVDFVLRIAPQKQIVVDAMSGIGYILGPGGMYANSETPITVEFPRGPLAIGRDIIESWHSERRAGELLHVLTVTDCIRDRFIHFWAWNDRSALEIALAVAELHRDHFNLAAFKDWTERERRMDSTYPQERVDEFLRRLA